MNAPDKINHDPSRFSYYVTDAFYGELVEAYRDWQRDDLIVDDIATRERFRMLLDREARLLDRFLYEEWLTLYVPEFAYWVPSTVDGGDPRAEIAVTFDD